ncbi:hypothetical protein [Actinacidiphila bryophytorum]|uniref:hypothetical protein n=1 Tax=Actinacidiphila bryophytorum TaxID=1436133 RepID=UPI002176A427|nr:hypothetical protein [Actinacidiphila bryophytorum]UWE09996.1 hypothetical protein NYE86_15600 [Actinacidiphila bryophytorum]
MKFRTALTRFTLPVAAAAGALAFAAAPAGAATVHPMSASTCGSTYCISVVGTSTHVSSVTITAKSGTVSGYGYVLDNANGYWNTSARVSGVSKVVLAVNANFPDGSVLCGGMTTNTLPGTYPGRACIEIIA